MEYEPGNFPNRITSPDEHQLRASFREIGRRVEAYRRGRNISAAEVAAQLGISRSNLYRIEQGEIVKVETVIRLAQLLGTSIGTLFSGGFEFIPQAGVFFERVRQIDAEAQKIVHFFGPISYLLTSDAYDELLSDMLRESRATGGDRRAGLKQVEGIIATLAERKNDFRSRRPDLVALVSIMELERLLAIAVEPPNGLSERLQTRYRQVMFNEAESIAGIMEDLPLNVSAGLFPEPLHSTPFQITRQVGGKSILQVSPFKLASIPNLNLGVAMITDDPEAVRYHLDIAERLWAQAIKGKEGARTVRRLVQVARSKTLS
jgi:transcriptional regulator with XRE-family HTH domain